MYTFEYDIVVGGVSFNFTKMNESDTILKRNMRKDIINELIKRNAPFGEVLVDVTMDYDGEYYDGDEYTLEYKDNSLELIVA
jgi:radical SAM superfamily enzyme with C-terminal helix-hairpin-helix motif